MSGDRTSRPTSRWPPAAVRHRPPRRALRGRRRRRDRPGRHHRAVVDHHGPSPSSWPCSAASPTSASWTCARSPPTGRRLQVAERSGVRHPRRHRPPHGRRLLALPHPGHDGLAGHPPPDHRAAAVGLGIDPAPVASTPAGRRLPRPHRPLPVGLTAGSGPQRRGCSRLATCAPWDRRCPSTASRPRRCWPTSRELRTRRPLARRAGPDPRLHRGPEVQAVAEEAYRRYMTENAEHRRVPESAPHAAGRRRHRGRVAARRARGRRLHDDRRHREHPPGRDGRPGAGPGRARGRAAQCRASRVRPRRVRKGRALLRPGEPAHPGAG